MFNQKECFTSYPKNFTNKGVVPYINEFTLETIKLDMSYIIDFKLTLKEAIYNNEQIIGLSQGNSPILSIERDGKTQKFSLYVKNDGTMTKIHTFSSEKDIENHFEIMRISNTTTNAFFFYKNNNYLGTSTINSSSTEEGTANIMTNFNGKKLYTGELKDLVIAFNSGNINRKTSENLLNEKQFNSVLVLGDSLKKGNRLQSSDSVHSLIFNDDGILSLNDNIFNKGLDEFVDQENKLQYTSSSNENWKSNLDNYQNALLLKFYNNGNVVLEDNAKNSLWSTNTVNKNSKHFVIHNGGSLSIYNKNGESVWSL